LKYDINPSVSFAFCAVTFTVKSPSELNELQAEFWLNPIPTSFQYCGKDNTTLSSVGKLLYTLNHILSFELTQTAQSSIVISTYVHHISLKLFLKVVLLYISQYLG
jgi:hypothetical protein